MAVIWSIIDMPPRPPRSASGFQSFLIFSFHSGDLRVMTGSMKRDDSA